MKTLLLFFLVNSLVLIITLKIKSEFKFSILQVKILNYKNAFSRKKRKRSKSKLRDLEGLMYRIEISLNKQDCSKMDATSTTIFIQFYINKLLTLGQLINRVLISSGIFLYINGTVHRNLQIRLIGEGQGCR